GLVRPHPLRLAVFGPRILRKTAPHAPGPVGRAGSRLAGRWVCDRLLGGWDRLSCTFGRLSGYLHAPWILAEHAPFDQLFRAAIKIMPRVSRTQQKWLMMTTEW